MSYQPVKFVDLRVWNILESVLFGRGNYKKDYSGARRVDVPGSVG